MIHKAFEQLSEANLDELLKELEEDDAMTMLRYCFKACECNHRLRSAEFDLEEMQREDEELRGKLAKQEKRKAELEGRISKV